MDSETKDFNVNDARELLKKAKSDCNRISTIVDWIIKNIEEKAKAGKNCLNYPFDKVEGRSGNYHFRPTDEEKRFVREEFVKRGFTWHHKDSQDPGFINDRPIDTISW